MKQPEQSSELEFGKELAVSETAIPGLLVLDLPIYGDSRGWFKENWQREQMVRAGLPDFRPKQNNISFNASRGVTRGIHAEPWDKYISVAHGRVFAAIVDLRRGDDFGKVVTAELDPSKALFVPRGCGNSFQALKDETVYTYLVNAHWRPGLKYKSLNLGDPLLNIAWPIPLKQAEISDKDRRNPLLDKTSPIIPRKILVTGANGQLGRALATEFQEQAACYNKTELDITDQKKLNRINWLGYRAIVNAAAYTDVDGAESAGGRQRAWEINGTALSNLASIATQNGLTLIHISSDYVFDGSRAPHAEEEPLSPLGVYGQSKAAGELVVRTVPKHYLVRSSWVVGDGANFVRTMLKLAQAGKNPSVVNDQFGRLTFAEDLAAGIRHLLESKASCGVYNLSNDGPVTSWCDIAREVYELAGASRHAVSSVSTQEYFGNQPHAPRPVQSELSLGKIKATSFSPRDWRLALQAYIAHEQKVHRS